MKRLVVNGCSYMHSYASGKGHLDLADRLSIPCAVNLSQSGCSNGRIIRTTLKDSFMTTDATLYVLGITFIIRNEIPILDMLPGERDTTSFEGRWTNPQNQMFNKRWLPFWTEKDTDLYVELMFKESSYGLLDKVENLMYQLVSLIDSLTSRGHKVLLFQQADQGYFTYLGLDKLKLFQTYKNFVNGFSWTAIQWQHEQNVPYSPGDYTNKYGTTPLDMRHRAEGEHQKLNEFLVNYINEYKILE